MSDQTFEPRPAVRLIEQRREGKRISVRSAAAMADISEGRWRQIAKGYQQAAAGIRVPANAPVKTLARMALALALDPQDLEGVGEEEVADELRSLVVGQRRVPANAPPLFGGSFSDAGYLANLEAWLLDLEDRVQALERGEPREVRPDHLKELGDLLAAVRKSAGAAAPREPRVAELREAGHALAVVCRVDSRVSPRPGVVVVPPPTHEPGDDRATLTDRGSVSGECVSDAGGSDSTTSYHDEAGEG